MKLSSIPAEEETVELLQKTGNLKHRALLVTAYSAGLRVHELVGLWLTDVGSKRMMIPIHKGKGGRDRIVTLLRRVETLREYYKVYKPKTYPFEGEKGWPYSGCTQ